MSTDQGPALPAGSSVAELGGRLVHLAVTPGRGPTVLLLGGCGVPSYVWDPVAARLGGRAVVRLDRPGLLGTPWPGRMPRLSDEVATLAALVDRIGSPVIAVGHSMAGPHAEALGRQVPEALAGLVLVDSSVDFSAKPPSASAAWLPVARGVRGAMRVPPLRGAGPLVDRLLVVAQSRRRRIYDPVTAEAKATYRRGDTVASVVAEQGAYAQQVFDLAQLRDAVPWPGPPTVVLTAAADGGESWVQDQRRLAELLSGRQVVLDDSRHLIMIDRPDAVVAAITSLVGDERPEGNG